MNNPARRTVEAGAAGRGRPRRPRCARKEEVERAFDDAEDVSAHVDWSEAERVNLETRRVNVDFPAWVVAALDRQARLHSVPRQSLIKLWIADRLKPLD